MRSKSNARKLKPSQFELKTQVDKTSWIVRKGERVIKLTLHPTKGYRRFTIK